MDSAADFGTASEILAIFMAPHFFLVRNCIREWRVTRLTGYTYLLTPWNRVLLEKLTEYNSK